MSKKVIVIGWDGATFKFLDPLVKKGHLPNLARLKKEGASGKLKSVLPSLTPTAWVTFATGKNPGHHGCYDFLTNQKSLKQRELTTSADIQGKTFYQTLEESGKKSILINLPLAFPPLIKNGILIPSFLESGIESTHPPDLVNDVPELKDYRLFFKGLGIVKNQKYFVNDFRDIERKRFLVAKKLLATDWDFFFCLFSASDWVIHRIPGLLEGKISQPALALFKDLDSYLGYFLDHLPKGSVLMLISDHGFKTFQGDFGLNRWLENEGYLKRQVGDNPAQRERFRLTTKTYPGLVGLGFKALGRFKALYLGVSFLSRLLNRVLPHSFLGRLSSMGLQMDHAQTLAYSPPGTFGEIFLNREKLFQDGVLGEKQADRLRKELINKLNCLKDPSTQKKVIKRAYSREDLYGRDCLESCPDIILEPADCLISSDFGQAVFMPREAANHDQEGIFLAKGPGIKKASKIKEVSLEDVAPTILRLYKIGLSREMSGRSIL